MMYVVKARMGRIAEWQTKPTLVTEAQTTHMDGRGAESTSCASNPDPMGLDVTDDIPIINVCSATIHSSA